MGLAAGLALFLHALPLALAVAPLHGSGDARAGAPRTYRHTAHADGPPDTARYQRGSGFLPSARNVSLRVFGALPAPAVDTSQWFVAWGQLISLDLLGVSYNASEAISLPVPRCDPQFDPGCEGGQSLSLFGTDSARAGGFRKTLNAVSASEYEALVRGTAAADATASAGDAPSGLHAYSWAAINDRVREGALWVVLDGLVLDLGGWIDSHPGGARLLRDSIGECFSAFPAPNA